MTLMDSGWRPRLEFETFRRFSLRPSWGLLIRSLMESTARLVQFLRVRLERRSGQEKELIVWTGKLPLTWSR